MTLVGPLAADMAAPVQVDPMPAGLGPNMRAEMVAARLRGAALDTSMWGPWVTVRRGVGDRRRERCGWRQAAIEMRT